MTTTGEERPRLGSSSERSPRTETSGRIEILGPPRLRPRTPLQPLTDDIDEQTELGEVLMRSLVRTQLRLGIAVLVVIGATLGTLPLLFSHAPAIVHAHLMGVPIPWLILGFAVYPFLLIVGWFYVRQAERNERDFIEVVDRR